MSQPEHPHAPQAWRLGATPHPAAVLLLWVFLAVALQSLHLPAMLVTGVVLVAVALAVSFSRFYTLLRRTRWVMLSLLAIYGYVTPGEAIWAAAGTFSPTLQGLGDGVVQLSRLVFALAGLSIVLSLLDTRALMGGIYTLARPLQLVGLSRERIAVRLALTLNYAETAMLETAADWRSAMARMLAPPPEEQHVVDVPAIPFRLADVLLIAAAGIVLVVALL
jgi:hypothetical protein